MLAFLVLAVPAAAQTPRAQIASLKQQLAAAKKTNSRLEAHELLGLTDVALSPSRACCCGARRGHERFMR